MALSFKLKTSPLDKSTSTNVDNPTVENEELVIRANNSTTVGIPIDEDAEGVDMVLLSEKISTEADTIFFDILKSKGATLPTINDLETVGNYVLAKKLQMLAIYQERGISTSAKDAEVYISLLDSLEDSVYKHAKLKQAESSDMNNSDIAKSVIYLLKNVTPMDNKLPAPKEGFNNIVEMPDLLINDLETIKDSELVIGLDDRSHER